ncbi:DUF6799 domain-containing protein [Mucilaginibacter kameinonensis]|uniref:DUF6799 domain-containing protein n=1 Tax=Mucilaginibacter kameinonensis TaxID=452286 RepID=UPI0013CF047B|nr:DUF6799 domain-containing protein [Mucilaginibacter kameinonensis]
MRKLLMALMALLFSAGVMAQTHMKMKDGVMMKDGKMMVMKEGKTMMMDKDMTMSNGTMVMTDGMVKMKDGKSMMLKNGQCVNMDGTIEKPMKMKHKKMVKDTTMKM